MKLPWRTPGPDGIRCVAARTILHVTPPIGFNLFVLLQGMTQHDIGYVAKMATPMFLIMVVMVFILIAAPELATWLPENMRAALGG